MRCLTRLLAGCVVFAGVVAAQNPAGLWVDVPFVAQEKNGCGSASLSMVMQYWSRAQGRAPGEAAEAGKIQAALYSQAAGGIFASAMVRYLQEHGFRAFVFSGSLAELEEQLSKGRPLIVALAPNDGKSARHYVVVAGVNGPQEFVLVNDPAQRKLSKRKRESFEKEWTAANNWTLLALPAQAE